MYTPDRYPDDYQAPDPTGWKTGELALDLAWFAVLGLSLLLLVLLLLE